MTAQLRSYKREQQAAIAATILASFLSIDNALIVTDTRYLLHLLFIALGRITQPSIPKCASAQV
jgi:hypothetical protein